MKILLLASGYLGAYQLIQEFHKKGIEVIGTDINPNSAARFYCDKFYVVSSGNIENQYYLGEIEKIVKKERPDVILPGSSSEVYHLAVFKEHIEKFGTKIMVGSAEVVRTALDKGLTYETLQGIIPLPKSFYSEKGLIIKPSQGKGARNIWEMDRHFVMEKLTGEEIDVDVLSLNGEVLTACFKKRERTYGGTLIEGEIVERPYLMPQIEKIVKTIPIDYLSVIQFIGDKLLEINPRIAGAIMDYEIPYMAIQLALGKIEPNGIKTYKTNIGKRVAKYLAEYAY